jgi:hypothetical protein
MKYELQNLIQGKGGDSQTDFIREIANYLRAGKKAGAGNEGKEYTRQQEAARLTDFIDSDKLWYPGPINENDKIGEGAEQKVYYDQERGISGKDKRRHFFCVLD